MGWWLEGGWWLVGGGSWLAVLWVASGESLTWQTSILAVAALTLVVNAALTALWELAFGCTRGDQAHRQGAECGFNRRRSSTGSGGFSRQQSVATLAGAPTAQECWENDFGKFKYTGLREDLEADAPRPQYSTRPLDIPLPQLSPADRAALNTLREAVRDLANEGCRAEESVLLRFLRARKGNAKQAEKLFREAIEFRRKWDVDKALTEWNLEAYEQCLAPWWLAAGILGRGLHGQPVALERLGRCNLSTLNSLLGWEALQKIDVVHCQRVTAALEEYAIRQGGPQLQCDCIIDMSGFTAKKITLQNARVLANLVKGRNLMGTEMIGHCFVVRAHPNVVRGWNLLKRFLDAGTVEKVQISKPGKESEMLLQHMSRDIIPEYLGGTRRERDDPECRIIVGVGGDPPAEAVERFKEVLASGRASGRFQTGLAPGSSRAARGGCLAGLRAWAGAGCGRAA